MSGWPHLIQGDSYFCCFRDIHFLKIIQRENPNDCPHSWNWVSSSFISYFPAGHQPLHRPGQAGATQPAPRPGQPPPAQPHAQRPGQGRAATLWVNCQDASAGERQRFLCAGSKCLCSRRKAYNRPCFVWPALANTICTSG